MLIFTGLVDKIGEVCDEHGLVPLTHDVEEKMIAGVFRESVSNGGSQRNSLDPSPKWTDAGDPFSNSSANENSIRKGKRLLE